VDRIDVTLASENRHKLRELRALLPRWTIEPLDAAEMPEETGTTFYANARAKSLFARTAGPEDAWTLGEDSGLEVDGLRGRPGIHSARYAGPDAADEENVARLLEELLGLEDEGRRARYVSELVLLSPELEEFRGTGTLEGHIGNAPRGTAGFGYDPVFVPEGETRTVAELGDAWKAERSHRARAAAALLEAVGRAGREG
jgi:XTP/dITP diphosphohydrolase